MLGNRCSSLAITLRQVADVGTEGQPRHARDRRPGSLNTQPRLDGYIQYIKEQGNPVTYDVVNAGPDPASEISRIESYYLSHKNVAGLFGTGGSDTYACGFVSNKYGLAKAGVIVAGFDLFPQTLGFIKGGDVNFTVDQQAYLQGFLPVQQMYLWHLSGGLLGPADTDTSHAYVTKDNIDLYLGKSRFEVAPAPSRRRICRRRGVIARR